MSKKSAMTRWGLLGMSIMLVLAMLVLGGCSKKEPEQTQETTTEEPMTATPAAAGTYMVEVAAGSSGPKITLTLNADNTAMMSTDNMDGQPVMVENGSWTVAGGGTMIDVVFQHQMGDSTMAMTTSFAMSGDTLRTADGTLTLVKHAATAEEGHSH